MAQWFFTTCSQLHEYGAILYIEIGRKSLEDGETSANDENMYKNVSTSRLYYGHMLGFKGTLAKISLICVAASSRNIKIRKSNIDCFLINKW